MNSLASILLNVLAPILLMIIFGAMMRWKFRIDMGTLSKLNIYLFMPAFVFDKVSSSTLAWRTMAGIVTMTLLQVVALGAVVLGIGKAMGVKSKTLAAMALAVMFYNSGNYGLPLAELAFQSRGAAVQSFVMMSQNILTFTVGLAIAAAAGSSGFGKGFITLVRMPILPALAGALVAKWWLDANPGVNALPPAITHTARYISNGLIPVALVTVGAQLASNPRWPRWKPVSLVLVLRLVVGPVSMFALLWLLHRLALITHGREPFASMDLWPWPAQLLVLTASVPTAVNTLLLTMEVDGDSDLAADCVFWSTVLSCVTIPLWLMILRRPFLWGGVP